MLTLCVELVIVAGIGALMLMSRKETFESDTAAVAGDIKTPIAIGQGQHGTARWLNRAEQRKAFSLYRLDKDERTFAALLIAGARDRREVNNYKDDIDAPTIAAAANDTLAAAAVGDYSAQNNTAIENADAEQIEQGR
jgi:type IV secretion system protein VirD4